MTLDEAIKHAEEVADFCEHEVSKYDMSDPFESYMACKDGKCAEEHRQLAEWLKELKRLKEQEPCEDCISREAVLAIAGDSCLDLNDYEDTKEFCDAIKELPPATPQPKMGRWIDEGFYAEGHSEHAYRCSECDEHYIGYVGEFKHCPNCGSKMKEGEEE